MKRPIQLIWSRFFSYEPDLILLRDSFESSVYEELSKIAPVAPFDLKDTEVSLLAMGKILGMEEQALLRLEKYHEKLNAAKETLSAVSDSETAMLRVMKKEVRLYPASSNDMSRFLYADLGLNPDPMAEEYDSKESLAISMELLPELTAEHSFWWQDMEVPEEVRTARRKNVLRR